MHAGPGVDGPILLVGSDRALSNAIAEHLTADGFAVELAYTAEHARVLAAQRPPALVLLGPVGHAHTAMRLLEEIRGAQRARRQPWDPSLPVIVLAGHLGEVEVLRAFECGADDVLARSAGYLQLRARVLAVLRRAKPSPRYRSISEVGALRIDRVARSVAVAGRAVHLRRMEFELLEYLAREPQRVCTREELLRGIWGYPTGSSTRTLATHASRLRHKLDARDPQRWVISVWGSGYRLI